MTTTTPTATMVTAHNGRGHNGHHHRRHSGESRNPFCFSALRAKSNVKMDPGFRRDDDVGKLSTDDASARLTF
jgi:hypothetical protein